MSKLYRIPFTGYCEVWADSTEEASDAAENDDLFTVYYDFGDPVCVREEVKDELD